MDYALMLLKVGGVAALGLFAFYLCYRTGRKILAMWLSEKIRRYAREVSYVGNYKPRDLLENIFLYRHVYQDKIPVVVIRAGVTKTDDYTPDDIEVKWLTWGIANYDRTPGYDALDSVLARKRGILKLVDFSSQQVIHTTMTQMAICALMDLSGLNNHQLNDSRIFITVNSDGRVIEDTNILDYLTSACHMETFGLQHTAYWLQQELLKAEIDHSLVAKYLEQLVDGGTQPVIRGNRLAFTHSRKGPKYPTTFRDFVAVRDLKEHEDDATDAEEYDHVH